VLEVHVARAELDRVRKEMVDVHDTSRVGIGARCL
jgi:hypothetical protein